MTTAASSTLDEKQPPSTVVSFIQSQKGKSLLILDKYIFELNKLTTSTKYWIYTLTEYSAKIHTNINDQLIKMIGEHFHPVESEGIDMREFRENVKQRALYEATHIPSIYDEECAKTMLSTAAIAILSSEREIKAQSSTSTTVSSDSTTPNTASTTAAPGVSTTPSAATGGSTTPASPPPRATTSTGSITKILSGTITLQWLFVFTMTLCLIV